LGRASARVLCAGIAIVLAAGWTATAAAQSGGTPAANPADAPPDRVGGVLFADYSYALSPEAADGDGNGYHPSAFNVARTYINITGTISRLIAFRVTPDIVRNTDSASSLSGSLTFRIKYAFAQANLDEWTTAGKWARFGIQQTPWVDFEENIYRYRFQGTVFSEREGFLSSSDAGASFHYNAPSNYGEVHVGVYNGENYNRVETNDRKAFQVRGSIRPFATSSPTLLQGLRAHVFLDADSYVRDGDRHRAIRSITYEHRLVNAGVEYLTTRDRTSISAAEVAAHGYSLWLTPRLSHGWELLLRHDRLTPNDSLDGQTRSRTIAGIAYWFPHQGSVSSALLLDYDGQTFSGFTPAPPTQQKVAVHALVSF
jgi:hypothetical protein